MRTRIGFLIARSAIVPALAVSLLAAWTDSLPAADPGAGPGAAIVAAHKKIDDEIKNSLMSPFTAINSHYFESGQTSRLGADEKGAAFDPPAAMAAMAEISYDGTAFWIAPVDGSKPPAIHGRTEQGDIATAKPKPVKEKTKLGENDVVGLGRFYMETSPQSGYGRVLVYDPDSPYRKSFTGLKWFEPNPALQVMAFFTPFPNPDKVTVATSRGLKKEFFRVGTFDFPIDGKPQKLTALAGSATPKAGEEIFVPFRDGTTGRESYDVGRYLNIKFEGAGATYVIDFNSATNPSCNYSHHYNCPIPPKENTLDVAIRAGEMTYPKRK